MKKANMKSRSRNRNLYPQGGPMPHSVEAVV